MFDDDGQSYGYEKGLMTSTVFECHVKGRQVRIVVNPVEGSFEGAPAERKYSFAVQNDGKASEVSVNGKVLSEWTYADGMITFNLDPVKVSEKIVIDIK
jgi:hypothetical protein